MKSNIIKIGNSLGLIIPSEIIKKLKLADKSSVNLELSGDIITIRPSAESSSMCNVRFYVCPVCGNILYCTGKAQLTCHGHNLVALEAKSPEGTVEYAIETVEDELFVSVNHEMSKQNYISFMAAVSADRVQLVKLFPEGPAEARFKKSMVRFIYFYSEKDGLIRVRP